MTIDHTTAWDVDRTAIRFPDPAIEIVDERFRAMVPFQAVVERLWTGGRWLEGPVWFGDRRAVLFSDIPSDAILQWDEASGVVSTYRSPSMNANGNTRDREGRLVTCEHRGRRVTRTEPDGSITVLADSWHGRRLNAPNDVVVAADGAVWFTDPAWGIENDFEGDKSPHTVPCQVYRVVPGEEPEAVIDDTPRPNGIAFSPDESRLYVIDTHIRVYDMVDGRPTNGRVLVDMSPGGSDGMRIDTAGNIWAAAAGGGAGFDGVHCYSPEGELLGRIHLPEGVANLAFGGAKRNRLFITASRSLYSVFVDARSATTP